MSACSKICMSLGFLLLFSCRPQKTDMKHVDIQGHRGCRGLVPENTIPAFKRALSIGVHTLELDVVINGDGDVLVSHEPFFNHEISTAPGGHLITESEELEHNVYRLSQAEIEKYDVGLRPHPRFELQKKMSVTKPLLSEVVRQSEAYAKVEGRTAPLYNIEIKRRSDADGLYHPTYDVFADKVIQAIDDYGIAERTTVQCFDVPTLQYVHQKYPKTKLVYLIENQEGLDRNLEKLGFMPHVYSPYYKLVDIAMIETCHQKGILVIPWTINEAKDVEKLIRLGVDGIISDYPDMALEVYQSLLP